MPKNPSLLSIALQRYHSPSTDSPPLFPPSVLFMSTRKINLSLYWNTRDRNAASPKFAPRSHQLSVFSNIFQNSHPICTTRDQWTSELRIVDFKIYMKMGLGRWNRDFIFVCEQRFFLKTYPSWGFYRNLNYMARNLNSELRFLQKPQLQNFDGVS